ncbi:hypothetical protein Aperf_G00000112746 [Anoplocephala perfoliata]
MNCGTNEWHLSVYRYFRETDFDPASTEEITTTAPTAKNNTQTKGIWLTRRDHSAASLVLRVSDYAHLVIMQGTEIVESYFLILAKKWIKMVNIEDEIMLYIRAKCCVRRLRLTFASVTDARSCYNHLAQFVSAKKPSSSPDTTGSSEEEDSRVAQWLSMMTSVGSKGGERVVQADAAWHTNWPTDRLVELVKLCLNDANFPGFVHQVQQCLRILAPLQSKELINEESLTEQ